MAANVIFISADHNLSYSGASNASTGAYFNAGTCTYALKDTSGTTLGTGTLAYVAASNGNYVGTIESSVTSLLSEDSEYLLSITFNQTTFDDYRLIQLRAAYRTTT